MPRLYSVSSARRHSVALALTAFVFLSFGSLYYWRANSVRLTYDGQTRRIFTKAPTLKEFLSEQQIALDTDDFITPELDTPILYNTAAKITRVVREEVVEISTGTPKITWQTQTRQNLRRIHAQRGMAEVTTKYLQIVKYDGIEVARALVSTRKTKVPFFTLKLLNKDGRPIKEYDLRSSKVISMRATGYYAGEKTVPGTVTFSGHRLQRGLVAVDPKVIPLGTRLYVQGYGYAYASDTGSAIKGNRIDLAVKDKYEEARFNRHHVPVYVLEKSKSW